MAFGKRKRDNDDTASGKPDKPEGDDRDKRANLAREVAAATSVGDEFDGPFDIDDFDDPTVATQGRHDLGSVLIPVDETAELAVEVNQEGVPTMVWMVTPNGRYNFTAYAAPKTGSLWREVVTEDGPWGREVVGVMTQGPEPVVMRFIGVDGYRWMIRGAAVGSPENADAIAKDVRKAMADTVVRRGETPMPVRYMLPLQLSESLVTRLRARAEQMVTEQGSESTEAPQAPQPVARRSEQGSAMQQLRTITGG
jgi:hypothetical protein